MTWFSGFEIRDINQEQLMSSDSSEAFCCIFHGMLFSNCLHAHMAV